MKTLCVLMLFLSLYVCSEAADVKFSTSNAYLEISTENGETEASKNMNIDKDKNKLEMEIKEIAGVKADNTTKAQNISNIGLVFANATNQTTGVAHTQRVGTGSNKVNEAIIKFTADIFTAGGVVTRDTENITVMSGDVRLSFSIDGFNFTGYTSLAVKIEVSGSSNTALNANAAPTGLVYNLGGKGMVTMSDKVMTTGNTFANVTSLTLSGKVFTVTFAQNATLEYSLILKLADYAATTDGNGCTRVTSLGIGVWLLVAIFKVLY